MPVAPRLAVYVSESQVFKSPHLHLVQDLKRAPQLTTPPSTRQYCVPGGLCVYVRVYV